MVGKGGSSKCVVCVLMQQCIMQCFNFCVSKDSGSSFVFLYGSSEMNTGVKLDRFSILYNMWENAVQWIGH